MVRRAENFPQDPEALGFAWGEWKPVKHIIAGGTNYTVLRSNPKEKQDGTIQFSIRRRGFRDDVLRVDSYKAGYFSTFWHSSATLREFLTEAERFLGKFEPLPEQPHTTTQPDKRYQALFIISGEPQLYQFDRPLAEADMEETEGLLTEERRPLLSLVKMNTPFGDFFYEPRAKRLGVLAIIDLSNRSKVLAATTKFITNTQRVLTSQIVMNTLNRLPYLEQPNPALS